MRLLTLLTPLWKPPCDLPPQFSSYLLSALSFRIGVPQNPVGGCSHSRHSSDIFCPRPPLVFVGSAEHDWLNRQTASQKKESRALWAVKFVRRKAGGID